MTKQDNIKKTNSFIKWIFATVLLITIGIGGSFFGGTFYPNVWTVDKLHKQFQKQELDEAQTGNRWLQLVMDNNPDKLEANEGHLIPVLVKAIQELSAKVKALEAA